MAWIRSHLGLIGIALLIAAMATGFAAITGTAASGLPFPFIIVFVVVLVAGFLIDRAARNASSGR